MRRYWPWSSIGAFVLTGVLILITLVAFAGGIALHRFGQAARVVGVFIFVASAWIAILLRLRERFDYFIDADAHVIRRWSPKGEITVRWEDTPEIEWHETWFVVRSGMFEIVVTRAYAGFRSLRRAVRKWSTEIR